jgi:hypothetical protein
VATMEGDFLDARGAGQLIGGRSPAAVRQLALRRRIPFRRVGGRLCFIEAELRQWILDAPGVRLEDLEREASQP